MTRGIVSVVDWVRPPLLAFREEDEARRGNDSAVYVSRMRRGLYRGASDMRGRSGDRVGSCGNVLGTWGEFKERARSLIRSRGAGDEGGSKVVSLDPLPR